MGQASGAGSDHGGISYLADDHCKSKCAHRGSSVRRTKNLTQVNFITEIKEGQMNTVNISVSQFEELVETKAKMESLVDYLNTEEGTYPSIKTVLAILGVGVQKNE